MTNVSFANNLTRKYCCYNRLTTNLSHSLFKFTQVHTDAHLYIYISHNGIIIYPDTLLYAKSFNKKVTLNTLSSITLIQCRDVAGLLMRNSLQSRIRKNWSHSEHPDVASRISKVALLDDQ